MVAETADVLSGVSEVERVAAVGCGQTQLAAVVDGGHVLEHRVDRLQDAAVQFLELAQFDGIVDAVVLQEVGAGGRTEGAGTGHRVTVHVRQTAVAGDVIEVCRSVRERKIFFIKCHWTIVSRYPWVHCAVNSMRSMIPWVVSEALQKYKRWNRYYVYTAGECEKPLGQKMENKNNANRTRCCDDRRRGCEQPRQGRARRFTRWRPSPGRIGISWRGKTRSSFAWSTIVSSLSLSLSFSHSLILSFSLSIWTWRHGKCVPSVFWSQVRTDFSDQFCSLKNKTRYRWPIDRVCRLRTCVALTARPDHWSHAGELLRFFEFHCLVGSVHPKNHPILLPSSMAH